MLKLPHIGTHTQIPENPRFNLDIKFHPRITHWKKAFVEHFRRPNRESEMIRRKVLSENYFSVYLCAISQYSSAPCDVEDDTIIFLPFSFSFLDDKKEIYKLCYSLSWGVRWNETSIGGLVNIDRNRDMMGLILN